MRRALSHLALGLDAVVQKLEERKDRTDLTRRASPKRQRRRGKPPKGQPERRKRRRARR